MLVGIFLIIFALTTFFSYDEWTKGGKGDAVVYMLAAIGFLALGVGAYDAL